MGACGWTSANEFLNGWQRVCWTPCSSKGRGWEGDTGGTSRFPPALSSATSSQVPLRRASCHLPPCPACRMPIAEPHSASCSTAHCSPGSSGGSCKIQGREDPPFCFPWLPVLGPNSQASQSLLGLERSCVAAGEPGRGQTLAGEAKPRGLSVVLLAGLPLGFIQSHFQVW